MDSKKQAVREVWVSISDAQNQTLQFHKKKNPYVKVEKLMVIVDWWQAMIDSDRSLGVNSLAIIHLLLMSIAYHDGVFPSVCSIMMAKLMVN